MDQNALPMTADEALAYQAGLSEGRRQMEWARWLDGFHEGIERGYAAGRRSWHGWVWHGYYGWIWFVDTRPTDRSHGGTLSDAIDWAHGRSQQGQ